MKQGQRHKFAMSRDAMEGHAFRSAALGLNPAENGHGSRSRTKRHIHSSAGLQAPANGEKRRASQCGAANACTSKKFKVHR